MESIEVEVQENKRDERGRQLRSAEQWAVLAEQYRQSGLTQKAFARREGIKYATFVAWLGRLRRQDRVAAGALPAKTTSPRFATFQLGSTAATETPLEVVLPDSTRLRGQQPELLAALVKALRDDTR